MLSGRVFASLLEGESKVEGKKRGLWCDSSKGKRDISGVAKSIEGRDRVYSMSVVGICEQFFCCGGCKLFMKRGGCINVFNL